MAERDARRARESSERGVDRRIEASGVIIEERFGELIEERLVAVDGVTAQVLTGIERLVLSSTMAVYGESMVPPEGAWGVVTERSPVLPRDVYGMSKWLCEDLARYYARRWGIATVSLRLGMFVPETFERYGFRLLFGGVDDRDVAQAVLLALAHRPEDGFDAFNVFADVPFGADDAKELHTDPEQVLERYWPGCRKLFEDRGLDVGELIWGDVIWPPTRAKELLGYRPRHNFGEFLAALRANDRAYYPFANIPWWGMSGDLT